MVLAILFTDSAVVNHFLILPSKTLERGGQSEGWIRLAAVFV
jgi:hypothetical protein